MDAIWLVVVKKELLPTTLGLPAHPIRVLLVLAIPVKKLSMLTIFTKHGFQFSLSSSVLIDVTQGPAYYSSIILKIIGH